MGHRVYLKEQLTDKLQLPRFGHLAEIFLENELGETISSRKIADSAATDKI